MTAPDLVEVVAGVLGTHLAVRLAAVEDGFYVECRCGAIGQIESDAADWEPANQWHAAHQARAVLAALTEAGSVEWGAMTPSGRVRTHVPDEATAQLLSAPHERVVSRLALPWTAVE